MKMLTYNYEDKISAREALADSTTNSRECFKYRAANYKETGRRRMAKNLGMLEEDRATNNIFVNGRLMI